MAPEPLLATEAQPTSEVETETPPDDSSSAEGKEQSQEQQEAAEKAKAEAEAAAKTEEAEGEKPAGAPEAYTFANPKGMPEGIGDDPEIHDAYAKAARELDLPQDRAQTLYDTTVGAIYKQAMDGQEKRTNEWLATAKADAEYGGENYEENIETARKAVKMFGSDGLREWLSTPNGGGDHPEMIRFMFKVGKAVSEDRFVGSNRTQAADLDDDAATAAAFYDNPTSASN